MQYETYSRFLTDSSTNLRAIMVNGNHAYMQISYCNLPSLPQTMHSSISITAS